MWLSFKDSTQVSKLKTLLRTKGMGIQSEKEQIAKESYILVATYFNIITSMKKKYFLMKLICIH